MELTKKVLVNENFINIDKMYWSYNLTKARFNYDLVCSFLNSPKVERWSPTSSVILYLKELKKYIPELKILSMLTNQGDPHQYHQRSQNVFVISTDQIEDTLSVLVQTSWSSVDKKILHSRLMEANSLFDAHDIIMDVKDECFEQDDYDLNQEDIHFLDKEKFDKYSIFIPKKKL